MPRLASLYLPNLAIDRIRRLERRSRPALTPGPPDPARLLLPGPDDGWRPGARWARRVRPESLPCGNIAGAMVTARKQGNQNRVMAVSEEARRLGLAEGMPLTKARILVPGLDVRESDPDGDRVWLSRLGLFAARRWTPRASVSGDDGLWLDLTGTAHLFGGEQMMAERILAFLGRLGFTARIAVAGTTGTAHALARFGESPVTLCPTGKEEKAIRSMPLAALRLDPLVLASARRLGLQRISEAASMPRGPLQRRFGSSLLLRLDQALGWAAEPFEPIIPRQMPEARLHFLEPIATAESLSEATAEAVRRLVPKLSEAALGVRRLLLFFDRIDKEVQVLAVGLARASRDAPHLERLLKARIEKIEPGFGIERLRLVAERVEPLEPQPISGTLEADRPAPDLSLLIDRLSVRLGARRLFRLSALESDLPERSVTRIEPLAQPSIWPSWPRPIQLLSPPEPVDQVLSPLPDGPPRRFRWRGRHYRVAAADGPERVYGEWWRRTEESHVVRDYFQVEEETGGRFWIFRSGDGEDDRTGDRSWHMHGIFS